jgi:hypothetical protein
MTIIEVRTGDRKKVEIKPIERTDFKKLTKKRYSFPWKEWQGKAELYKLCFVGADDILGVMAFTDVPGDQRIEINLLAVSIENKGSGKVYDGIIGCLIAYACSKAAEKYNKYACVSLVPKTVLREHYIKKYGMRDIGMRQLFLEEESLANIILTYRP